MSTVIICIADDLLDLKTRPSSVTDRLGFGAPAPTKNGVSLAGNVSPRASSIRRSRSLLCVVIPSEH
jgi:hypothetical protein